MLRRMGRKIGSVVAGLLVGALVIFGVEAIVGLLYPMPVGMNPQDPLAFNAYLATLPPMAFVLVLLGHGLGSFVGAGVATLVARRESLWPAMIVGGLATIAGIVNLVTVPHPLWFNIVDGLIYLPLAYLAARLLQAPSTPAAR